MLTPHGRNRRLRDLLTPIDPGTRSALLSEYPYDAQRYQGAAQLAGTVPSPEPAQPQNVQNAPKLPFENTRPRPVLDEGRQSRLRKLALGAGIVTALGALTRSPGLAMAGSGLTQGLSQGVQQNAVQHLRDLEAFYRSQEDVDRLNQQVALQREQQGIARQQEVYDRDEKRGYEQFTSEQEHRRQMGRTAYEEQLRLEREKTLQRLETQRPLTELEKAELAIDRDEVGIRQQQVDAQGLSAQANMLRAQKYAPGGSSGKAAGAITKVPRGLQEWDKLSRTATKLEKLKETDPDAFDNLDPKDQQAIEERDELLQRINAGLPEGLPKLSAMDMQSMYNRYLSGGYTPEEQARIEQLLLRISY